MTERVTHRSIQQSSLAHLQGNLQSIAKLQEQASTGRKINTPSDDPTGTVTSLAVRQQQRLNDQYGRAAEDGLSWMSVQDTALQTASSQLQRAQNLVVQSLNTATQNPGTRAANAAELDGITQTVKSMMNSAFLGRSVFAGTSGAGDAVVQSTTAGVTTTSWSLTGTSPTGESGTQTTSGTVDRQVDGSSAVRVDTDGRVVFGDDTNTAVYGPNVLTVLGKIKAEIQSPSDSDGTALRGLYGQLQDRFGKVLEGLADVGARTNRIEQAQSVAASAKVTLAQQLSDAEDADLPTVLVQLQLQSTAYQASLTATNKVLSTSLMDFLR